MFRTIVIDRGSENIREVIMLLNRIGVNRIKISLYNSYINRTVEQGFRSI